MSTALAPMNNPSALSTSSNALGETEITLPQIGALAEQQRAEQTRRGNDRA